ncbi:MAG: TonB-dependent receptor [Chitinophagaceae bacterium]|jgi:hypothetical protein|nr:TonB-dependent receptor [Chitinophagaceae bacterium]
MKFFLTLIFIYTSIFGSTQPLIIKGHTQTKKGESVATTITLHEKKTKIILAFTFSDSDGHFELKFNPTNSDTLELKAALLGYGSQSLFFIPGQKTDFQFSLSPEAITLPEVKVAGNPVWKRKDTINYQISEFRQQQDRVIGDIIARLPGIEVLPGGQIKYQGKPINKYYIEGLDLLEDRYGIANNNIPAESVEKVQVLENHQPIRVLDSISFSDRAALNIRLKNSAKMKLIGRARFGIGFSPLLSEDELTGMLFKKKIQFINTYKYNNTGLDNTRELNSHNINDYINALQNGSIKSDLVSIGRPGPPPISQKRYLFNNNHVASINQLVPLNATYQIRVNAAFVNDYQSQQSSVITKFYLPADTISIIEQNKFHSNLNVLQSYLSLMTNSPKFYMKNTLKFQSWWSAEKNRLLTISEINQRLSNPFINLSNDFKLLKAKKKYIEEWASYLGYVSLPQSLNVRPGQYEDIVNNNQPYDALIQIASLKTFYTDNNLSLRKRKSKIVSQYKLGFNVQFQHLLTDLMIDNLGIKQSVADTFQNKLNWQRYRVYNENSWSYENNKWQISFRLPLNYTKIYYKDTLLNMKSGKEAFFINPEASIMLQLDPKWNISVFASYTKDFGDISGISSGYMLKTYRSLANNNAPLAETSSCNISASLTYRNPLNVVFFNTGIIFSRIKSNLLYSQQFNGNLETLTAFLRNNYANRATISGRFSKYIIDWKTSIGFNYSYSFGNQQQWQQSDLLNFSNKNFTLGTTIALKLSSKLTADYNGSYFTYLFKSQLVQTATTIQTANQDISVNYFPTARLILKVSAEHYYVNNKFSPSHNYYFADVNLRYKPKKSRLDYELTCQNLLNTKAFTTIFLSNNIETVSEYQIRPIQALFKINFSF